ncbi:hypothetical protein [uncultured Winogradskyella sp.]|uniref:hypothetical protein n=1 Tax=uncultured Winogradskyella sp. TaxID=395353 RepID=UPI002612F31C|nr:hypothetical protein [uncultured Winogradskyella sp.]
MERYNFTNRLFLFKIEAMIRRFSLLFCLIFLVACDDGDIMTVDLNFEGDLESCDDFENSYLVFDTRSDPNEALILIFDRNDTTDALFTTPTTVDVPEELLINETNVRFIYRSYNRSVNINDICAIVSPGDLTIVEDYEADSGTVDVTVTIVDDDNDGIPSEFEYGPGGLADPQDSDLDGIPDYLDEDDDNDNVKTINEIDNSDGDNDPTTAPLNTDGDLPNGDEIPDYLDTDDDGDGVLTRLEDEDGDMNPLNDTSDNNGVLIAHYLNNIEVIDYGDPGLSDDNAYTRTVTTHFLVKDIDVEILRATEVDLGTLITTIADYPQED